MDTRPIWQDCGEPGNIRDGTAEGGPSCTSLMNQKRLICYINGKTLVLDAELPGLAAKDARLSIGSHPSDGTGDARQR